MLEQCSKGIVVGHSKTARLGLFYSGLLVMLFLTGCATWPLAGMMKARAEAANQEFPRFVVSFPEEVHPEPVTARVLLLFSQSDGREPRYAVNFLNPQPAYAIDVNDFHPGAEIVFSPEKFSSPEALAFPQNLNGLEPGVYCVQALIDLDDTRATYYAGPGNLYSRPVKCKMPGSKRRAVELVADQVIEEEPAPVDTDLVKLVEIRSRLLSDFHGREMTLRAGVILPALYDDKPDEYFPTMYYIPGFGGNHKSAWRRWDVKQGKMLRVFLDPEVPQGHSVFANSANNGPVGDALVQELIPAIENRFRAIPQAHGRFVTGHSSGGWASLWLQITYPDFFGGCWSSAPDPVDFTHFQTMNIYEDRNGHWTREGYPRPLARDGENVAVTFGQLNRWEYVVGYGFALDSFNAVFSPRGSDGKPRPLMDKLTGAIDPEVAEHWRRYDIRHILEENWESLGPKLAGKLHIIGGAWDTFYLNTALEELRDFLASTNSGGYVEIRPGNHHSFRRNDVGQEMSEHFSATQEAHTMLEQAER